MADTEILDRAVALDLRSLMADDTGTLLSGLDWPTPYGDYAFVSTDLVDAVIAAARDAATSPELEAVSEAKLSDTVTDLAVIARLTLDLQNLRATGRRPLYDGTSSTWMKFLDSGGANAASVASQTRWYYRKPQGAIAALKRRVRRLHSDASALLRPNTARHDVLSRNTLLDEFFAGDGMTRVDISPNYREWPTPCETPHQVRGLVSAVTDAFAAIVPPAPGHDKALAASAQLLAEAVIAGHFGKAWADLARIRALITNMRAGAVLASGTPKHIGRLFGWQYKQLGRQVLRFAHGGERAFYDDYAWALAELPYCDRYVCHSQAEAVRLELRRSEGRMAMAGPAELEFASQGSAKHQAIRARQVGRPKRRRSGSVMYVAGGYLGEWLGDFPSRKPPDVLYFEWQTWFLQALRSRGLRVVTKVHPQGIMNEAGLLRGYSDDIVGGYFDSKLEDVDCYIFDFAGTAFFDALASNRGVVLLDMGIRLHDDNSFNDLRLRCEIVECTLIDGNRFRVDADALADAVERASAAHSWPDSFFETCFGS